MASPHSGRYFPPEFLAASRLPVPALRRLEDAHVGALLADSVALGLPLMEATHGRAVIDLNRAEAEYDPALIAGRLPDFPIISERVRRGHGLFPRLAGAGQAIHDGRIAAEIAEARIAALHRPWHRTLADGMEAARRRHGYALLLDMHSMPSLAGADAADLVLGDRRGRSAAAAIVDWLEQAFRTEGLRVARNQPYAGGHTTERHGRPADGLHAVQLEFDRALYMEPVSLKPHAGFGPLGERIARVLAALLAALPGMGLSAGFSLAAE
nr:N-formylglutamate amidohydrolase [Sandaracinobacteroides sayramensis]